MENTLKDPSYLFETSWEVCNKVGGIYTVVSTKSRSISEKLRENYILIGPDLGQKTHKGSEFTEDLHLLKSWRNRAKKEGLRIRVGRWNIAGNPTVILVDFTQYIQQKNEILSYYWKNHQVDSLNSDWDYIESALFGYASGKVIESFVKFRASARQKVVAHFHEWMTGSGLLYVKENLPQVGTVFTTHATVLGRCIAGNGLPLYNNVEQYSPNEIAERFNVKSKYSMEYRTAQNADCITTVSDITAKECEHFLQRKVSKVTPNGFEDAFVPKGKEYTEQRKNARKKLIEVANAVTNTKISKDALLVGISGRYEFRNKGIDLFLRAINNIKHSELSREIVAFVLIPAGNDKINEDVSFNLENPTKTKDVEIPYVTHELFNANNDPIINTLNHLQFSNDKNSNVKVVFCPCYLDKKDGIFNTSYYETLIGLDATVFPSYYEPWGYTPLESLAFKIPTITTSLAGFGLWVQTNKKVQHPSTVVIERNDYNDDEVTDKIAESITEIAKTNKTEYKKLQTNAKKVSETAVWKHLVAHYFETYQQAIDCSSLRNGEIATTSENEHWTHLKEKMTTNTPNWFSIIVHRTIPKKLIALEKLSKNLWWSWNDDAHELFEYLDPKQWKKCRQNPILLLDKISLSRYKELEKDKEFVNKLETVYQNFTNYMAEKEKMKSPAISYFSMEYGLHSSLKIYSGGLGILAGDYLKEASDKGTNITAVGLLYRYGYFTQKLSASGNQEAEYEAQDFSKIPVSPVTNSDGSWVTVSIDFPGRTLNARVWKTDVGRVDLYLLDTDFEDNREEDRSVTHHLYGGNWENRLKQEMLLGNGGIKLLKKLGVEADVYHCNEGHAAFIGVERLKNYIAEENLSFTEAVEVVKSSSLFTTHTPVPAGHDAFGEDMLRRYLHNVPAELNISWEQFLSLGKVNAENPHEKFSMSFLAANLSQEINGVSWLHGKVSQDILRGLWPGYFPEELHINYVTNGVHHPTWTAKEWKEIQHSVFGEAFLTHHYDKSCFDGIYNVSNEKIAETRNVLRKKLITTIHEKLSVRHNTTSFSPRQVVEIKDRLRDDILTIGFARRFATYKRAHLLFSNIDRLNEIVNNPDRPVQFIFAGKAHPADKAGQDLIKHIVEISKQPQFLGKILFLPNYDMNLARTMIQGVDVWMNTPTRPLEASGTSGEKGVMNGVMHFSVLDGWWVEGYQEGAGWALPLERTYENQEFQNELDSELLYNTIEDEIAPAFYNKDKNGISEQWSNQIKNTIAKVASNFTMNRMVEDYEQKFYYPMAKRYHIVADNNYKNAIELAEWKKSVSREWDCIMVDSLQLPDKTKQVIESGKEYKGEITLDIGELDIKDVGVELVITRKEDGKVKIHSTHEYTPIKFEKGKATYEIKVAADASGLFMLGLRIFPKHPLLPHRQDFALVKWV